MRNFLNILSPILLILVVVFYWYDTSVLFNPIAIVLILLLIVVIITKGVIVTVFSSSLIGLLSLYMMLAVISEYREFPVGDAEGSKLLAVGLSIFISTFALSVLMSVRRLFYSSHKTFQTRFWNL